MGWPGRNKNCTCTQVYERNVSTFIIKREEEEVYNIIRKKGLTLYIMTANKRWESSFVL